ncbi:hypothetical protein V6N13_073209 [Hibiscus sabdariffa]
MLSCEFEENDGRLPRPICLQCEKRSFKRRLGSSSSCSSDCPSEQTAVGVPPIQQRPSSNSGVEILMAYFTQFMAILTTGGTSKPLLI